MLYKWDEMEMNGHDINIRNGIELNQNRNKGCTLIRTKMKWHYNQIANESQIG